ncbi:MAG: enoyl-CoA hydratase [Microbacterium sp.]|uniref:enoyl-CoA hydratase n=1 Tax=Microbacterium sp. TaxID=51671 RepID=UPI001D42F2B7|nr:enoyl-CoA hydratase [Microbacterium sp.]MBW8764565.1 enoyl-CoA hydratase [Microbacterium sp.]
MAAASLVRYDARGGVACLTLDRPGARNALNSALVAELDAALTRAEQDPEIAAIVITGSDPAFCAGLDIREFNATGRPPVGASDLILRVATLTKPTIGAVNGPVTTGGLELALGIDILVASERATFADTHASVGILPGGGMTARLPRVIGPRLAIEMSFTGRVLDASEALHHGLVTHLVQHEELVATAQAIGETIASRNPSVVQELKRLYRVSLDGTLAGGLEHEISERDARRARGGQLLPSSDRVQLG